MDKDIINLREQSLLLWLSSLENLTASDKLTLHVLGLNIFFVLRSLIEQNEKTKKQS